jgi:hypothetical protein
MQRTLSNRAAGAMLGRQPIQAKLTVNAPVDQYEREGQPGRRWRLCRE